MKLDFIALCNIDVREKTPPSPVATAFPCQEIGSILPR